MLKEDKKNILIVIDSISGGGAELVVFNLCKYLNRELFNVSICHLKERGIRGEELVKQGFDVIGIPRSQFIKKDYFTFRKLRQVLIQKKIDIVHSHTTYSLIDSSLCKLFNRSLKLIHTFHFGNYPHYTKKYMLLEKLFCKVPNMLVAVGNEQKRSIQHSYKIPSNRIITIWNGVEDNTQHYRSDSIVWNRIGKNKIIVGTISTFIEQKGLTFLLDVAAALKKRNHSIAFVLAGDGPLRNELELKCQKLGLEDTVFFLGWLKNAALEALPFYDIFFQPSLWEAMSMVILEAMAAGKAIVATNVGENMHILEDGKNAFLVKPKDINNMVLKLDKLINNPHLRMSFGNEAKLKYFKYFTVDKMINKYESLYLDILGSIT